MSRKKHKQNTEKQTTIKIDLTTTPFQEAAAKAELQAHCNAAGLIWNEGNWQYIVPVIVKSGVTHVQAVELVKAHITLVAHLFNPSAYPWKGRLLLALHFLLNLKRKKASK